MKWIVIACLYGSFFSACRYKEPGPPEPRPLSREEMQSDFEIVRDLLIKSHPSIDSDSLKTTYSHLLDSVYQTIPGRATVYDFYNKVSFVINELGCLHTYASLPATVDDTLQNRAYFFPFPVLLVENKLLVNMTGGYLPGGTEILEINNVPADRILRQLMFYNGVDGAGRNAQLAKAADDFSYEYFLRFGKQNRFLIKTRDSSGFEAILSYEPITYAEWLERNSRIYYYNSTAANYDLSFNEKKNYAYMRIATLSYEEESLRDAFENFCVNAFDLIHRKKNIRNLIIDIRENHGGNLRDAFFLFSYLCKKTFREYESVHTRIKRIPLSQYLDKDFAENERDGLNKELSDDFEPTGQRSVYRYKDSMIGTWDRDANAFDGKVFVIVNHNVESAASYFAMMVKNSGVGKIVGEETSGGAFSGNGFQQINYRLPFSAIKFGFAFAHLSYLWANRAERGRGVVPDYDVPDTRQSFNENNDQQIKFIIDSLIN